MEKSTIATIPSLNVEIVEIVEIVDFVDFLWTRDFLWTLWSLAIVDIYTGRLYQSI